MLALAKHNLGKTLARGAAGVNLGTPNVSVAAISVSGAALKFSARNVAPAARASARNLAAAPARAALKFIRHINLSNPNNFPNFTPSIPKNKPPARNCAQNFSNARRAALQKLNFFARERYLNPNSAKFALQ
jgi:hypothetical protein